MPKANGLEVVIGYSRQGSLQAHGAKEDLLTDKKFLYKHFFGSRRVTDNAGQDGAVYATFQQNSVEWNLITSYGSSSIENDSGTVFGSSANMDAFVMAFYLGVSEEAVSGTLSLRPLFALQVANYSQEEYDEVSQNAVGKSVDEDDRWCCQSILGLDIGSTKEFKKFDLITRFNLAWQHEFNDENEGVGYTLIGGVDRHQFTMQAPVADSLDAGLNFGMLFRKSLEFSAGLNGRFSKDYNAIGYNAKLQYTF